MPRGHGTGPMGMGPMTGRAAGYCASYPVPGFMNPYGAPGAYGAPAAWGGWARPRLGFGMGMGWRRGRGGRARGFGRRW